MIQLIKNAAAVGKAVGMMLFWLAAPIAGVVLIMAIFPLLQVIWLAALGLFVLTGFWSWVRRGFKSHPDAIAFSKKVNDDIQALLQEFGLEDTWENRCRVTYWREKQSWSYRDEESFR